MSFLAQNIYVYFTVQFWNRQKRKGLGIKFNCDYTVNNKQIWMIAEWRKFPSCKFEGRGGGLLKLCTNEQYIVEFQQIYVFKHLSKFLSSYW